MCRAICRFFGSSFSFSLAHSHALRSLLIVGQSSAVNAVHVYVCKSQRAHTQNVLYTHQNITLYKLENITASHFLVMIWIFFAAFVRLVVCLAGPMQQWQQQQRPIYCLIIHIHDILSGGSGYEQRLCL